MKIQIQAIPGTKQARVDKISVNQLRVHINAPARQGRANQQLIKILSNYFKIPQSNINIVRGRKSRSKLVEILKARH